MRGTLKRMAAAALIALVVGLSPASAQSLREYYATFTAYQESGDWRAMLRYARAEVAAPSHRHASARAYARIAVILAQMMVAGMEDIDVERIDPEMRRLYDEALELRSTPDAVAVASHTLAQYYIATQRSGLALPLQRITFNYWRRGNFIPGLITSRQTLADLYDGLGDNAAAAAHYRAGFDEARRYFSRPVRTVEQTPPAVQWQSYQRFLNNYGLFAAENGWVDEIEAIWPELRRAAAAMYPEQSAGGSEFDFYTARVGVAQWLSIAGAHERAREVFAPVRQMRRAWQQSGVRGVGQIAFPGHIDCADAGLAIRARQPVPRDAAQRCAEANQPGGALAGGRNNLHEIGVVLDAIGDEAGAARFYDLTVRNLENYRASFDVTTRTALLNQPQMIGSYHGLHRIAARRAEASQTAGDFFEALATAERGRARQFFDAAGAGAPLTAADLTRLAERLPADAVALSIVVTEAHVIAAAFTRSDRVITTSTIDNQAFRAELRNLRRALSSPRSDAASFERSLDAIAETHLRPVLALIPPEARVYAVVDGPLATIPLGLFRRTPGDEPLGLTHDITILPALRSLSASGREPPAPAGLFAVGDPTYPASVDLSEFADANLSTLIGETRGLAPEGAGVRIRALPETRSEVASIGALFPSAQRALLGADARESRVKREDLSGYRYLHFATHGVLGGELPGLGEPALLLAGERGEDAFLRASEIRTLRLNAALVTLSACNTGNGEYLWGEGIMGLSRAFMEAGARSVAASLWAVDSAVTEDYMVAFYRAHATGSTIPGALRAAATTVRAQHQHPYYWAPFVVISNGMD